MLYQIGQELQTQLAARGCPLRVVYGPERLAGPAFGDSRIVLFRPREQRDTVSPPKASKNNPPRRAERAIAATLRVLAKSPLDGAALHDHEEMADQAVDLIIASLQVVASARYTSVSVSSGGLVPASTLALDGLEQWPGVAYDLQITVQRAVYDRTWAGDDKDTTPLDGITTTGTCVSTNPPPT